MTVTVPNTFATLPATPNPSLALFDQNFAALVAAINTLTTQVSAALVPRGSLSGLTLSNDGTTPNTVLDISAGTVVDSTNTVAFSLPAFTKTTTGAWLTGLGQPGMGVGLTIAASTWYHVFAIVNATNSDIYFDTSVTAANKPIGTTAFRRIGSFLTDGAAHIIAFSQNGDEFIWAVPVQEFSSTTVGTTPTLLTLAAVPPGVVCNGLFRASGTAAGNWTVLLTATVETSAATDTPVGNDTFGGSGAQSATQVSLRTSATPQIRYVASAANTTLRLVTYGYVDTRGRFA